MRRGRFIPSVGNKTNVDGSFIQIKKVGRIDPENNIAHLICWYRPKVAANHVYHCLINKFKETIKVDYGNGRIEVQLNLLFPINNV